MKYRYTRFVEDLADHGLGHGVPRRGDRARVGVLELGAALLELPDGAPDALEDVQRLEPGHDDGHAVPVDQGRVLGHAHHRADVPRGQEALDPAGR